MVEHFAQAVIVRLFLSRWRREYGQNDETKMFTKGLKILMVMVGLMMLPIGFCVCGFSVLLMLHSTVRHGIYFVQEVGVAWLFCSAGISIIFGGSFLILRTAFLIDMFRKVSGPIIELRRLLI